MDADRFDTLSRSLSLAPSRRGAFRLLVGSALGGLVTLGAGAAAAHDALKKCKKKSGKQKKKCLKKARKHNATHAIQTSPCTPNCSGKACGDDGCGGSCGDCTGGTCDAGTCTCAVGTVRCGSGCVPDCGGGTPVRDPVACTCCTANGELSTCGITFNTCCSGMCADPNQFVSPCIGRPLGATCQFGAQCTNGTTCCGACVDTATDAAHCGGCGMRCGGGQQCSGGECATPPPCRNDLDCLGNSGCCSGACSCGDIDLDGMCEIIGTCNRGANGKPCHTDADCFNTNCVGFVCRAP